MECDNSFHKLKVSIIPSWHISVVMDFHKEAFRYYVRKRRKKGRAAGPQYFLPPRRCRLVGKRTAGYGVFLLFYLQILYHPWMYGTYTIVYSSFQRSLSIH
jgi:hypothetical protein